MTVKSLVIIIVIMITVVIGKLFSIEWIFIWRKQTSFWVDSTIAIALQTLRSIGENYEDELLYVDDDDDFGTSLYCEHVGGLLMKVVGRPKTTQKQKTDILQELRQITEISIYRYYIIFFYPPTEMHWNPNDWLSWELSYSWKSMAWNTNSGNHSLNSLKLDEFIIRI